MMIYVTLFCLKLDMYMFELKIKSESDMTRPLNIEYNDEWAKFIMMQMVCTYCAD